MLGFRLLSRQPPRRLQQELVHPLVLVRRLGDSRYPDTWAARHSLLFAERLEDELDGVTYEDSYELDDDEHDLDRAEEELGRGLSEEALHGLHLFRLDEEHGHRIRAGRGSERARKAVRAELAARR